MVVLSFGHWLFSFFLNFTNSQEVSRRSSDRISRLDSLSIAWRCNKLLFWWFIDIILILCHNLLIDIVSDILVIKFSFSWLFRIILFCCFCLLFSRWYFFERVQTCQDVRFRSGWSSLFGHWITHIRFALICILNGCTSCPKAVNLFF